MCSSRWKYICKISWKKKFWKGKTVGESPTAIFINLGKELQAYIITSI
jgi:hypothetical protein